LNLFYIFFKNILIFAAALTSWVIAVIVAAIVLAMVAILATVLYTRSRRQASPPNVKAANSDNTPDVIIVGSAGAEAQEESSIMFIKSLLQSTKTLVIPQIDFWNPFQSGIVSNKLARHGPAWASDPKFWVCPASCARLFLLTFLRLKREPQTNMPIFRTLRNTSGA
jgi:hypothetical protein